MTAEPAGPETVDGFLGNRVRLIQPNRGHRAGLDAALLQALIPDNAQGRLVDLGTGCGAVAMAAAVRAPALQVAGVDFDTNLIDMAERALALPENAELAGRVRWIVAEIGSARPEREAAGLADDSADWVTMNPPFEIGGLVRASPSEYRRKAHIGTEVTLADWVRTAAGLLKPKGRLALIHRADALANVLAELGGRFGAVTVLPVHPHPDKPATRILVTAVRGSNAPLRLFPPLVLYNDDGGWSEEASAILESANAITDIQ
jgi:tRNA1(Val) A37 N6-methylase TrmN6